MPTCTKCGKSRHWQLGDGRLKCRHCGHRFSPRSVWDLSRLSERTKHQLLEWFVLGVPVYRQRFRGRASAPASERFYRLVRAVCAWQEDLRGPLAGQLEIDETTFGGARRGKRGWGAADKVIVFGILKRNGLVRVFAVPARNSREIALVRLLVDPSLERAVKEASVGPALVTLGPVAKPQLMRLLTGSPAPTKEQTFDPGSTRRSWSGRWGRSP